ncbi:MAG: DUF4783 domain-containing protein [Mediterranea sp.]|jgi:hypothetical protein|nr:DUF4783 domain-containing protein [Mediterranea sp.]
MKRIVFFVVALLIGMPLLPAQDIPPEVISSFKKGEPQLLNNYLGDKAELIIQDRTLADTKQLVINMLTAFYTDNPVTHFTVNHQGKRDESSFIIGTLGTSKGNYRVNCFFKKTKNLYVIHQIRIDKTNE